jgi:hypothetical protein
MRSCIQPARERFLNKRAAVSETPRERLHGDGRWPDWSRSHACILPHRVPTGASRPGQSIVQAGLTAATYRDGYGEPVGSLRKAPQAYRLASPSRQGKPAVGGVEINRLIFVSATVVAAPDIRVKSAETPSAAGLTHVNKPGGDETRLDIRT